MSTKKQGCKPDESRLPRNSTACLPGSGIAPQTPKSVQEARERVAAYCKALGHPTRLRILEVLAGRETCVCGSIVEELGMPQSTVSQHLKVLRDAGFVQGSIEGPCTCYCLDESVIADYRELSRGIPALQETN